MSKEDVSLRRKLLRLASVYKKSKCFWCSSTKKLEIHHINEDWKDNSESNLQTLCRTCHLRLHFSGQFGDKWCSVPDCIKRHKGRGMCEMHLRRFKHHGTTDKLKRGDKPCIVCGAEYNQSAGSRKDLCNSHRLVKRRHGNPFYKNENPKPLTGFLAKRAAAT